MLEELGEGELGGARLVAALEGLGRARARPREIATVHAEIAARIESALAERDLPTPPPPRSYPAELAIAVEGKEIARTEVRDPDHLLTEIADVFRGSQVSREYRQLAKLLPAGNDSRARALQRRLGSLLATPVMRRKERTWLAAAP
jgi:hypothetical protein